MFSNRHTNNPAAASKRTRSRLAAFAACVAVAGAASVALAGPAAAAGDCAGGHFCAFDNGNYGNKLLDSTAGSGSTRVDVADDRVSSVSNRTGNKWIAKNALRFRPDQTVIEIAPFTDLSYVGNNANDKIDHFDVR